MILSGHSCPAFRVWGSPKRRGAMTLSVMSSSCGAVLDGRGSARPSSAVVACCVLVRSACLLPAAAAAAAFSVAPAANTLRVAVFHTCLELIMSVSSLRQLQRRWKRCLGGGGGAGAEAAEAAAAADCLNIFSEGVP